MILRLVRVAAGLLLLTFLAVAGWTLLWPLPDPSAPPPRADAILCLGAGVGADGSIPEAARGRLRTCAALHAAGAAPVVLVSEGTHPEGTVPGAVAMAAFARDLGVPADAIVREDRARSTLQNALFARFQLPEARTVIVVTETFHLPRAWASHRWAGFDRVVPVASGRMRPAGWPDRARLLLRETLAIWFNAARAAAFSAAGLTGMPAPARLGWLE